jgi:hypothetical protein
MKKRNWIYVLITILLPLTYVMFSANSSGIGGKSVSGCTPCHGGTLDANTTMTLTGIPAGGYTAGQTYTVILNVTNQNYTMAGARAGFNLSVNGGTLTAGTGQALVGTAMQELRHSSSVTMTGGVGQWQFTWVAPTPATGTITFNIAGNATNGNNATSGDAHNQVAINYPVAPSVMIPTVNNSTPTNITQVGASLNGFVNANGGSTTVTVEYGLTSAYGSSVAMTPSPITGNTNTAVTAAITGLTANTLYHYRITAVNAAGTSSSADATFTTLDSPLGTNDFSKDKWSVYPNPATTNFTIQYDKNSDIQSIQLMTVNGKMTTLQGTIIEPGKIQIDASALAKGLYFIKVNAGEQQFTSRIYLK